MRRTAFRGVTFLLIMVLSLCFCVLFKALPLLPLLLISPKWFRTFIDLIGTFLLTYFTALMELVYGIKVIVSGDKIESGLSSNNLLVMNHRTRLDWMFFWCCLYRQSILSLHNLKISLKSPLKHFPGLGWASQLMCYIFMDKKLEKDEVHIARMLQYYRRMGKDVNVLLFPEGKDLKEETIKESDEYADAKGLPHYRYVLHPRSSGLCCFLSEMRQAGNLKNMYDITVAYRDSNHIPLDEPTVLRGGIPHEIHCHVTRHPVDTLPTDKQALKEFCAELYKAKERVLCDFYTKDKNLHSPKSEWQRGDYDGLTLRWIWQWMTLVYWIPFTLLSLYITCTNTLVLSYVIICVISLVICGKYFGGLDNIQTRL